MPEEFEIKQPMQMVEMKLTMIGNNPNLIIALDR